MQSYFELAHDHAHDTAVWSGVMVLSGDDVLNALKGKALQTGTFCNQEDNVYMTAMTGVK